MTKYISYFIAKELLKSQLKATPDEIAEWVSYGKENGELNAYTIRKFDDEPEPFIFGSQNSLMRPKRPKKTTTFHWTTIFHRFKAFGFYEMTLSNLILTNAISQERH